MAAFGCRWGRRWRSWAAALGRGRQHAGEDNRGPGRCDSVGWLGSLVDGSGAVGVVRQAMAGLSIERGRD